MIAVSSGEARKYDDKPVWGFVNAETGKEVFKTYGFIDEVGNGLAQVLMPVLGSDGYADKSIEMLYNLKTGKNILPEGYKLAGEFEKKLGREVGVDYQSGLEPTDDLIAIIEAKEYEEGMDFDLYKEQLKMGYINANGDIVVPPGKYKRVEHFTHGKGRVQDYNLKWGFIDNKGNEIIKPQFDVVTHFVEGKAVVGIFTDEKASNAGSDHLQPGKPVNDYMTDWYILVDETYTSLAKNESSANEPPTTEKAVQSTATVLVNGAPVEFDVYTINGNNYFKLRDIAKVFDIGVTWDGATNTVVIDTSVGYVE